MFIDRTDENPSRPLNGSFCFAGENYTWMNLSSAPISVYAGGAESTKRVRLLQISRKNRPAAQKRRIFGDRAPGTGAIDFLRILLYYKSSYSSGRAVFPGAKRVRLRRFGRDGCRRTGYCGKRCDETIAVSGGSMPADAGPAGPKAEKRRGAVPAPDEKAGIQAGLRERMLCENR